MQSRIQEDLPRRLQQRLLEPLPGAACWTPWTPELCYGRHAGPPPPDARSAAVLVLLYQDAGTWRLPLIVRPDTLSAHAGQVSLPGGEIEAPETIAAAALRECREELGTTGSPVQLLGSLSPVFVFASNYLVAPVVAWTPQRPAFVPQCAEVAHLLEPTLDELRDPATHSAHVIERRGMRFRAPHIACGSWKVWGATSLILAELLHVLARDPDPRGAPT